MRVYTASLGQAEHRDRLGRWWWWLKMCFFCCGCWDNRRVEKTQDGRAKRVKRKKRANNSHTEKVIKANKYFKWKHESIKSGLIIIASSIQKEKRRGDDDDDGGELEYWRRTLKKNTDEKEENMNYNVDARLCCCWRYYEHNAKCERKIILKNTEREKKLYESRSGFRVSQ